MKIPILDLRPQYEALKEEIHAAIEKVLVSGAFIMGPEVKQFESACAEYLGVKHAIGLNSGTDALFIAMRALGIGPGDEVITSPFSFFATAEAISHVGATPVFVDICKDDYLIDVNKIEAAITSNTKAIIPVHLYGSSANMGVIMDLARRYGLAVVEDCAQSFGARYVGGGEMKSSTMTGAIGTIGTFSFFPSKNLGAYGDGGLFTTSDDDIAEQARMLRVHGAKKKYHNEIVGYNSRLDTLQAAILQVKLPYIDSWNSARRAVAKRYNNLLSDVTGVITPRISEGSVFHQYTIRILGGKRDILQKELESCGIGTMIYYPIPQDMLPVYANSHTPCAVSKQLAGEVLSLPIWPEIEVWVQEEVVNAIKRCLA